MLQHQERLSENKDSLTVSNNMGSSTAIELKDNREHSVVQQKLIEKTNHQPNPNLTQRNTSGNQPVQRIIIEGSTRYIKSTLKTILNNEIISPKIQKVLIRIRTAIGGEINEKWLDSSWNSVVKAKDYDIDNQSDQLVLDIVESYRRSKMSGDARAARGTDSDIIAASMNKVDNELHPVSSGRERIITHDHPHQLDKPENSSPSARIATHISTMVLAKHPLGVEVQGALQHDGRGMMLSSNKNKTNNDLIGQLKIASDLKNLAAELLLEAGADDMPLAELMKNRILRHASKFYLNASSLMASDAPITVPDKVEIALDGLHAEIRIQLDKWTANTHELPQGTRLPCMGCYLYFNGQGIQLGKWMGPLWVSNPGIAMQIKKLLLEKVKIGKMGEKHAKDVGDKIASSFAGLPDDTGIAHSKKREGTYTIAHDPDSESDIGEEEHKDLQERLKARKLKMPKSPQWHGMEDWSASKKTSDNGHSKHHDNDSMEEDEQIPDEAIQNSLPLGVNTVGMDGSGGIRIKRNQLPTGFIPDEGVEIFVEWQKKKIHYISEYNGVLSMDYVPA